MSDEEAFEQFEAEIHAPELFETEIAYKNIMLALGFSFLGSLLLYFGASVHTKYGHYALLISVLMMISGVAIAYILRHRFLYKATGEGLDNWFRYFRPDQKQALLSVFEDENWGALSQLVYALNENETDNHDASGTSSLLIDVHGVSSGEYIAVQVVEFVCGVPAGITPLKVLRSDAGRRAIAYFRSASQAQPKSRLFQRDDVIPGDIARGRTGAVGVVVSEEN